jgi:hypothetical protein
LAAAHGRAAHPLSPCRPQALEAACQEAVDVSVEGRVLTITAALPSGGDVADLWAALELAGMAGRHLEWVADTLLRHVLPPVLDGAARFDAHVSHGGDSAIVKWLALPPGQLLTPGSVGRVEADCAQLLRVLADALFRGRASTLAAFGAAFWPRFVGLYQAAFERQLQSQGAAVLRGRQRAAAEMEASARDLGLLAAGEPSLGAALGRAVQASYHAAQAEYLERARAAAAAAGPGAAAVTVGAPLPIDAAFYQRYKEGNVKVGRRPRGLGGRGGEVVVPDWSASRPGSWEAGPCRSPTLAPPLTADLSPHPGVGGARPPQRLGQLGPRARHGLLPGVGRGAGGCPDHGRRAQRRGRGG